MPARAGGDRDDPVHAHVGAFARVTVARDVVEDKAAIGVDRGYDPGIGAERQHDDRDAMARR